MGRLATPAWLLRHAAMLVAVAGCLWLCRWQIDRAADGNALSLGYAIEWPVFAGFVVLIWAREVRAVLRDPDATPPEPKRPATPEIPGVERFDLDAAFAERAERDRAGHRLV